MHDLDSFSLSKSQSRAATLVRFGRYDELVAYARAGGPISEVDPIEAYFVALGLIHLGWLQGQVPEGTPHAEAFLSPLRGATHRTLQALGEVAEARAALEADTKERARWVDRLEALTKDDEDLGPVRALAQTTQGLFLIRMARFPEAEATLAQAADGTEDRFDNAEIFLGLGRLRAWQGRVFGAEHYLSKARRPWAEAGNRLRTSDVDYERGFMFADRRSFDEAVDLLKEVLTIHRASSVGLEKQQRTMGAYINALLGAGQYQEAEALLQRDPRHADEPGSYRFATLQRDLARLILGKAKSGEGAPGLTAHVLDAAQAHVQRGRQGQPPGGYAALSLDLIDGQVMARLPGVSEEAILGAADRLARTAEAFSGASRERPHEVSARLSALEAYLDAARLLDGVYRSAALDSARDQLERLARVSASISLRLSDADAIHVLQRAEAEVPHPAVSYFVRILTKGGGETAFLSALGTATPLEALELLARAAEAVGERHRSGDKPIGLTPAMLLSVEPGQPVLRREERVLGASSDRKHPYGLEDERFLAPERLRTADANDYRSDFYVLGAMTMARFFGEPPPNRGFFLRGQLAFKRAFRSLGSAAQEGVWDLAQELTSLEPQQRPGSAQVIADRLRSLRPRFSEEAPLAH